MNKTSSSSGAAPPRNWLIYDKRSECFWGPNRGGYFKSLVDAGLYTEAEAKEAEDFAKRYGRMEVARPLEKYREQIERLHGALAGVDSEAVRARCAEVCRERAERWRQEHLKGYDSLALAAECDNCAEAIERAGVD